MSGYIDRLRKKKKGSPTATTYKTYKTPSDPVSVVSVGGSLGVSPDFTLQEKKSDIPTATTYKTYKTPSDPGFVGFVGTSHQESPEIFPPYSRPSELATWPIAWRQRWAELTADLEDAGCPWPESEMIAFTGAKGERGRP
jgi:hypothetical protein